jgi:4-hydroxy-tetrahydrodipicolinate reductase
MKIALLGKGKTGSKVKELAIEKGHEVLVFDSKNTPTTQKLGQYDLVISFLPGPAFLSYIPMLLETKLPVVSGSTGVELPNDLDQKLKDQSSAWIQGHNFSLGMNLIHEMINTLSKTSKLFKDFQFEIHEVHHTKKLDAPSGTAIKWKEWLDLPAGVTSERTGDVVGLHELTLTTPTEKIFLRHEALDRKIFAAGALWAGEQLINKNIPSGLNWFEEMAKKELL